MLIKPKKKKLITRREFCRVAGMGLAGATLIGCGSDNGSGIFTPGGDKDSVIDGDMDIENELEQEFEEALPRKFRVAFLADTHIIDDFYEGPEGSPLDTKTIFESNDNFMAVRDYINSLDPPIDLVTISGDFIHNYPSKDWDFYMENKTRIDIAKEIIDGFNMPVHVGLGNHDYDVGDISREFTQDLFREKLGLERTYYDIDHRGFKFIMLDNFLGSTHDVNSPDYGGELGSFGEEQLNWLDAKLSEGMPSFVFTHYPLLVLKGKEVGGLGLKSVIKKHEDVVQLLIAGHTHLWMDWREIYKLPHIVLGSTRYDRDAYMLLELDSEDMSFKILNEDKYGWGTNYSEPFEG